VRVAPPPDVQLRELPQIRDARVLVTGAIVGARWARRPLTRNGAIVDPSPSPIP
jgi:hypothetical protein